MIDLHTHTTASDGVLTPTQLIEQAAANNITTIAITDHDTVNGIAEGFEAAAKFGITLIPGIEISTRAESFADEIHLVGLFINPQNPELQQKLELLHNYRETRNKKILDEVKKITHNNFIEILKNLDRDLLIGAISGEKFKEYFFENCKNTLIFHWFFPDMDYLLRIYIHENNYK